MTDDRRRRAQRLGVAVLAWTFLAGAVFGYLFARL